MRRRPVDLALTLDDPEFEALKRLVKGAVDYRNDPLVVEGVSVRAISDQLGASGVGVTLRLRVDETIEDVEGAFRARLAELRPTRRDAV